MQLLHRLLLALALALSITPSRAAELDPPITVGDITLLRYAEGSYEDNQGRTYYSGVEIPTAEDAAIVVVTPRTPPAPPAAPHRILKDTIIQRVKAANKLADLRTMITGLDADSRFEWDNSSWFHSNNALLVGGVQTLGLDPATILAADPLAP